MEHARRNVFLLACCQALLFTNNVTLISLNGLAGFALADNKALATLPVTGYVVGAALSTYFASLWMKRVGRRNGFLTGTLFGLAGGAIATLGIWLGSFWTLVLGTLVLGTYNAFGQYYRFAAADATAVHWKARAISLVMAGGLVGGIIGPEMSKLTRDLVQPTFLASYASLMGFCLVTMAILAGLRIPDPKDAEAHGPTRPLKEIMAQPVFVVAVVVGALGYGVMNLLMVATPLAMSFCQHPFAAAAFVIQWHVVGMYAPGFVTGDLIKRFGVLPVILLGVLLVGGCVAAALAGNTIAHFTFALVLLGVGWNFMYTGATTLLTQAYEPAEKAKVQGLNDFIVFATMGVSSLSSGALVSSAGWERMNLGAVPVLMLVAAAVGWLAWLRRGVPRAA